MGPLSIITRDKYKFHDTRLSGSVQFAYQALAIDDENANYRPEALRAYFKRVGDARSESSYPPAMNWLSRLRASFGG